MNTKPNTNLTASQLKEAYQLAETIETAQAKLTALLSGQTITVINPVPKAKGGKRTVSPETRARISAGLAAKWAARKAQTTSTVTPTVTPTDTTTQNAPTGTTSAVS